ncbi:MAG: hypothetical protein AAGD14_01370 [Planctomycetota bacterium]
MPFDVRDLTPAGWLLALFCVGIAGAVAVGCGLWAWSALSHDQIRSGLQALIFAGGFVGVAAGWLFGALATAWARERGLVLAKPKNRDPDHDPGSTLIFCVTLGIALAIFLGVTWLLVP